MGVYIPNMKSMFKTCGDCPLDVPNCRLWEELENLNTERHPNCPLIEIDLERDIPTIWYNRQTGQYEPKGTKQEVYERLYKLKNGERRE